MIFAVSTLGYTGCWDMAIVWLIDVLDENKIHGAKERNGAGGGNGNGNDRLRNWEGIHKLVVSCYYSKNFYYQSKPSSNRHLYTL